MNNKYWNVDTINQSTIENEEFILTKINNGEKTKLNVHIHSIYNKRFPKLIIGNKYYIPIDAIFDPVKYDKCIITDIKSGIIFYRLGTAMEEKWLEEFSFTHLFMEPIELNVNLSSKYYEVVGTSGKMKVNYLLDTIKHKPK